MSNHIIIEDPQAIIDHIGRMKRILDTLGETKAYYDGAAVELEQLLQDTNKQVDMQEAECEAELMRCKQEARDGEAEGTSSYIQLLRMNYTQLQMNKKKLEQCQMEFVNLFSDINQIQTVKEALSSEGSVLFPRIEKLMTNLLEMR